MKNIKRWKKQRILFTAAALAVLMAAAVPKETFAKEEEDPEIIETVSLTIDSSITAGEAGGEVIVTTDDTEYEVDYVEIKKEPSDRWLDGDKPKIKILLTTDEEEYIFKSGFPKRAVELSGDEATVTSVSRKKDKLTISVTLKKLSGDEDDGYDMEVYDLAWDKTDGDASWDGGDDTDSFEVRLLKNDAVISKILPSSMAMYSFAPYLTGAGKYSFEVRGVFDASHKGEWEESDSWEISEETAVCLMQKGLMNLTEGVWVRDQNGWWYRNPDNSYTVNNWQQIQEKWYFFDEAGYRKTGWIFWQEKWYYCDANGPMLQNTTTPDGYFVGSDGVWVQ